MAQTINTNIASLTAQRNLNNTGNSLYTSLQRLSSGLRINSSKDDAAGLAISERFTSQIRGLDQAARNANDGVSLAQTAEGAMAELTNNLQRIRELAVQSANATNSASDRAALQAEVSELLDEIDRVAKETTFNGVSLLDGSFTSQVFQVGANAGQTISIDDIGSARTSALGEVVEASVTTTQTATTSAALTINGETIAASATAAEFAANVESAVSAIDAEVTNASLTVTFTDVGGSPEDKSFTLNGTVIDLSGLAASTTAATIASAAESLIEAAGITGITVTSSGDDITIVNQNGGNIAVTASAGDADTTDATTYGSVEFTSSESIVVGGTVTGSGLTAQTTLAAGSGTYLADISVATVAGATSALDSVDAALTSINSARAELGAIQNRFESVVRSLQTTSENLSASRSRILDADFAAETANLTRAQILQQAGTAMLAQANALPQNVLSLLQ